MSKYSTLAVAFDADVTVREHVQEFIDFLVREMQAVVRMNDQNPRNAISFINSGSAAFMYRLSPMVEGNFEDTINSTFEIMEKHSLVVRIPNDTKYPFWEPTQKLCNLVTQGKTEIYGAEEMVESLEKLKPVLAGFVSVKEHAVALEIIALDFVDRKIVNAMNSANSGSILADAMKPADLLKRVRGVIMDHGLEFRLTKPLEDTFGIPNEICRVQLVKTLYPMDADLLQSIVDLYCNKGH